MLGDAQSPVLLTQHRLSIKFLDFTGQTVCLDSGRDLMAKYSQEIPEVGIRSENLSDLIYTSGSTGVPKGVLITHRSLANHSLSIAKRYQLCSQDRVLQFASISFDVAAEELFPSLLCGATVIVRAENELGTMREFEEFSLQHGLTVVNLPAAYWQEWVSDLVSSDHRLPPSAAGNRRKRSIACSSFAQWKRLATDQVHFTSLWTYRNHHHKHSMEPTGPTGSDLYGPHREANRQSGNIRARRTRTSCRLVSLVNCFSAEMLWLRLLEPS